MAIARRFLYDTADAVRLDALVGGSWAPLAELVGKIVREERYHVMHAGAWLERMAAADGEPRERLLAAWETLGPDAATIFSPLAGETALRGAGILSAPNSVLEERWRAGIAPTLARLALPMPPPAARLERGRLDHGDAFGSLWRDFTSVRRSDIGATW